MGVKKRKLSSGKVVRAPDLSAGGEEPPGTDGLVEVSTDLPTKGNSVRKRKRTQPEIPVDIEVREEGEVDDLNLFSETVDDPGRREGSEELPTPTPSLFKRLAKKIRADSSDDEAVVQGKLAKNQVTIALNDCQPPKPLKWSRENGQLFLGVSTIEVFFNDLRRWRTFRSAEEGVKRRNSDLIDPDLRGWLSIQSRDTQSNPSGKMWAEMTDGELREFILARVRASQPGKTLMSPSSAIVNAIDGLLQTGPQKPQLLTASPHQDSMNLGAVQTAVESALENYKSQWEQGSVEDQQAWLVRLLQILFDPRIKGPLNGLAPPKCDLSHVPLELKNDPHMHMCLFLHDIIMGTTVGNQRQWQLLNIEAVWEAERGEDRKLLSTPSDLLMLVNRLITARMEIGAMIDAMKWQGKLGLNNPTPGRAPGSTVVGTSTTGLKKEGHHTQKSKTQVWGPRPNECYACGRPGHLAAACHHKDSLYANRDKSKSWASSPMGQLFKRFNPLTTVLPIGRDPQGNALVEPKAGKDIIHSLDDCIIPVTVMIDNRRQELKALLDTGAAGEAFVSSRLAGKFQVRKQDKKIITGVDQIIARTIGVICKLELIIYDDLNNCLPILVKNVSVIDMIPHVDIILGYETIKKYDLTNKLRSRFIDKPYKEASEATFLNLLMTDQFRNPLSSKERQQGRKQVHPVFFAKEEMLDLLEDSNENPFWKEGMENIIPESQDFTGRSDDDDEIPVIADESVSGKKLVKLLKRHREVFARTISPTPAKIEPMILELIDPKKWRLGGPPRQQSLAKQNALLKFLDESLKLGLIVRSQATAYSQVVMVPKPNGKWRFCVDYRSLNENLVSMGWPIPNIDRMFQRLGSKKAKYFAVLDLTSGYHQVLLDEKSRALAAFITDFGVFEPTRVWMGIKSAPSYFQQCMSKALHGLMYDICEIYIDDIIIFGTSAEKFRDNLAQVLERLKECGLTLNPDKAKIGLTQLEYVGRVINEHGVIMSEEKIRKVVDFALPTTQKQMKQFLGLVNYFRAHVRGFAVTAQPLYAMTEGYSTSTRAAQLVWTPKQIQAFEEVKEAIKANPLLHFMDEQLPIFVATDASEYGIGAYLYQTTRTHVNQDEIEIPVAFLSQALTKVQRRWSTIEKECYAIWFALQKWEYLLRDVKFTILTDHRNLKYLNANTPKVVRWKLAIQEFDFVVKHIEGTTNVVADAFSRLCESDGDDPEVEPIREDKSVMNSSLLESSTPDRLCVMLSDTGAVCPCSDMDETYLCVLSQNENIAKPGRVRKARTRKRSHDGKGTGRNRILESEGLAEQPNRLRVQLDPVPVEAEMFQQEEQSVENQNRSGQGQVLVHSDESFQRVISQNANQIRIHSSDEAVPREEIPLVEEPDSEVVVNKPQKKHERDVGQVHNLFDVTLTDIQRKNIAKVHNAMVGHMGLHLTMQRLKQKNLIWPGMRRQVQKYLAQCATCQKLRVINMCIRTMPFVTAAPNPMERLAIDTVGPLTPTTKGYAYILVVIDCFSRYVELYPLHSTTAKEASERLLEHVGRYGEPIQILSDGGTQFVNETVQALCAMLQIDIIKTTAYSKEENGLVERANKEVLRHLRAFIADNKVLEKWSEYLPLIQRIMNTTIHSALGVSPADIVFGNSTRLEPRLLSNERVRGGEENHSGQMGLSTASSPTLRAWIDNMLDVQSRLIRIAQDHQYGVQEKHVKDNMPSELRQPFKKGDLVLCAYPMTGFGRKPPNKLLTPLRGPFRVVAFDKNRNQYTLQHLNNAKTFAVDPTRVQNFQYDPAEVNPTEVALMDNQEFEVKDIHGMRGNPRDGRHTLYFLVEWTGYVEKTWEPWSNLNHNLVLKEYLKKSSSKALQQLAKHM
mgnify:CR=1 FL=1